MRDVTVFGADWCKDTQRILDLLTSNHVSHMYINIDRNALAERLVQAWYPSGVRTPVVVMEMDGLRLVEPTDGQLLSTLVSEGLIDKEAA